MTWNWERSDWPHFTFDPRPLADHEDLKMLEKIFIQKVFRLLLKAKKITPWIKEQMATWKHTGFSIDASVRISPGDKEGLFRLLRYMARPPLAKERLAYDRATGTVTLFSAKDCARIVATHNVLEFLALLSLQVPPKGSHLIRYFGWYASRARYLRAKTNPSGQMANPQSMNTLGDTPTKRARRKRWAQLIKQVFELNPRGNLLVLFFCRVTSCLLDSNTTSAHSSGGLTKSRAEPMVVISTHSLRPSAKRLLVFVTPFSTRSNFHAEQKGFAHDPESRRLSLN